MNINRAKQVLCKHLTQLTISALQHFTSTIKACNGQVGRVVISGLYDVLGEEKKNLDGCTSWNFDERLFVDRLIPKAKLI